MFARGIVDDPRPGRGAAVGDRDTYLWPVPGDFDGEPAAPPAERVLDRVGAELVGHTDYVVTGWAGREQ
jgi:hypothetical protein